jgi:hypothetical protein
VTVAAPVAMRVEVTWKATEAAIGNGLARDVRASVEPAHDLAGDSGVAIISADKAH